MPGNLMLASARRIRLPHGQPLKLGRKSDLTMVMMRIRLHGQLLKLGRKSDLTMVMMPIRLRGQLLKLGSKSDLTMVMMRIRLRGQLLKLGSKSSDLIMGMMTVGSLVLVTRTRGRDSTGCTCGEGGCDKRDE